MTVITVREELIAWYEKNGYQKTGKVLPFPVDERYGIPTQPLEMMVLEKHYIVALLNNLYVSIMRILIKTKGLRLKTFYINTRFINFLKHHLL